MPPGHEGAVYLPLPWMQLRGPSLPRCCCCCCCRLRTNGSAPSLGAVTGYSLVMRALSKLSVDTFFGPIVMNGKQRNGHAIPITSQVRGL